VGKQIPSGPEVAAKVVSGQFTATGRSGNANAGINAGQNPQPAVFKDVFNAALWGTFVATVRLEKRDASGSAASYTAPCALGVYEPEHNVIYSWNCTSYISGTINYRISQ